MKRPILILAVFFSLGILLSSILNPPFFYLYILAAILTILSILGSRKKVFSHVSLYLAVVFLGGAIYSNSNIIPSNHIANFTSPEARKVLLKGIIVDDPTATRTVWRKEKYDFTLKTTGLNEGKGWSEVTGLVKVNVYSRTKKDFEFGEEVVLEGLMAKPGGLKNPGLFDYSGYLKLKNIHALLKVNDNFLIEKISHSRRGGIENISYKLRGWMRKAIDRYLVNPYSGFLKAILIGDKIDLDDNLKEDFVKTGTVHIIAISGLNVGLIAGLVLALFGILGVPKRPNLILTLIFLVFYSFTAGANPPIVRAVIMFGIYAIGYLINRDTDILNSLALAALLILLWNPKELFDPSFQLSFISLAGMVVFCPKIDKIFGITEIGRVSFSKKIGMYILKGISVSIAAWLGSWPFIAAYFNIISPISIIANLVIVPLLFVMTAASFLLFLIVPISEISSNFMLEFISHIERITFAVNHYLAGLPLSFFRVGAPTVYFSILYYLLLFIWITPDPVRFKNIRMSKRQAVIIILILFNVSIWDKIILRPNRSMEATFLDVGQGDAAFVEFPDGKNILIDAGSGGTEDRFDIGKSVVAPYLWNKGVHRIDAVIASHFHEDHIGGLIYILNNFSVGCVIDNGSISKGNGTYDEYRRLIKQKGIRRITAREGDAIDSFAPAKIFILNPEKGETLEDSNDNSLVLKLDYGKFSILFCGDIKDRAMARLDPYDNFLKSDILKVPHHGGSLGDDGVVTKFFSYAKPDFSIIDVGRFNIYNMPSAKTINIITRLKSICYTTKDDGAITISVDLITYKIRPYKWQKN